MPLPPVYLVPAPDMDERAVRSIQVEGREVVALKLEPLHRGTDLETFLANLRAQIHHERPALLGFCYGGVLALELARRLDVERVVLVSGVTHHRDLAPSRKLLAKLYVGLPTGPLRILGPALSFFVNNILRIKIHIPRVWQKTEQNKFLLQHALAFEGSARDLPIVRIHGSHDLLLPLTPTLLSSAPHLIEGGGHFLFIDKPKELRELLSQVFRSTTT